MNYFTRSTRTGGMRMERGLNKYTPRIRLIEWLDEEHGMVRIHFADGHTLVMRMNEWQDDREFHWISKEDNLDNE